MKNITVNVTAEHIKCGRPAKCRTCPVALAILPLLKEGIDLLVWHNALMFMKPTGVAQITYYDVPLPDLVCKNIFNFDVGISIEPFSFEVSIDDTLLS